MPELQGSQSDGGEALGDLRARFRARLLAILRILVTPRSSSLVLALLITSYYAYRSEVTLKPVSLPLSILLLLVGTAVFFTAYNTIFTEKKSFWRECFLLILGSFALFAFFPGVWQWLTDLSIVRGLWRSSPSFRFVGEVLFYAFSIALAILVMYLGYGKALVRRYLLRVEIHFLDVLLLLGLSLLTLAGLLVWFRLFSTGQESWSPLGLTAGWAVIFGVTSSLLNSIAEEFWFRGFFLGTLARLTSLQPALLFQALLFGFIHLRDGIPQGYSGWFLAGIWGYALGLWTLKRLSVWPALILHFITDLFIFFSVNRTLFP